MRAGSPPGSPAWRREPRWAPALAILVLISLPLLPEHLTLGPSWLVLVVGGSFLIAIVIADPTRPGRGDRLLVIGLTVVLIMAGGKMTIRLTDDLIQGGPTTSSPTVLLSSGALVWINSCILFGLLYWQLDSGGPAARTRATPARAGLSFPQQMNPGTGPPHWRPIFADYLYVGFTNGLAFSPTDAMPLAIWAKLTMALQAIISFVVSGSSSRVR